MQCQGFSSVCARTGTCRWPSHSAAVAQIVRSKYTARVEEEISGLDGREQGPGRSVASRWLKLVPLDGVDQTHGARFGF